jgi:hypothetical protein
MPNRTIQEIRDIAMECSYLMPYRVSTIAEMVCVMCEEDSEATREEIAILGEAARYKILAYAAISLGVAPEVKPDKRSLT